MLVLKFDAEKIVDWGTFHDLFSSVCGFPDYYGRNMNAWIDCVSDLGEQNSEVLFEFENMAKLKDRCLEQYNAILDCSAFVNYRFIEAGGKPFLFVSFG